jgi:hypothetical protein
MTRIKIPLSKDGEAEIEIDTAGGTIWVHSKGVTVMRVSTSGPLEQTIDDGRNFIDARVTFSNHIQITLGPGSVVEE